MSYHILQITTDIESSCCDSSSSFPTAVTGELFHVVPSKSGTQSTGEQFQSNFCLTLGLPATYSEQSLQLFIEPYASEIKNVSIYNSRLCYPKSSQPSSSLREESVSGRLAVIEFQNSVS